MCAQCVTAADYAMLTEVLALHWDDCQEIVGLELTEDPSSG